MPVYARDHRIYIGPTAANTAGGLLTIGDATSLAIEAFSIAIARLMGFGGLEDMLMIVADNRQARRMSATSHFEPSSGFHPVYKTCVPLDEKYADCSLHLLYTFPPDVLVDPYELENYKSSYTFNIAAVPDLELPVFAADPQNLSLFVNVVPPQESSTQVCIELPIHLRYGRPSNSTSHEYLEIPCPFTYLICGGTTSYALTRHASLSSTR